MKQNICIYRPATVKLPRKHRNRGRNRHSKAVWGNEWWFKGARSPAGFKWVAAAHEGFSASRHRCLGETKHQVQRFYKVCTCRDRSLGPRFMICNKDFTWKAYFSFTAPGRPLTSSTAVTVMEVEVSLFRELTALDCASSLNPPGSLFWWVCYTGRLFCLQLWCWKFANPGSFSPLEVKGLMPISTFTASAQQTGHVSVLRYRSPKLPWQCGSMQGKIAWTLSLPIVCRLQVLISIIGPRLFAMATTF